MQFEKYVNYDTNTKTNMIIKENFVSFNLFKYFDNIGAAFFKSGDNIAAAGVKAAAGGTDNVASSVIKNAVKNSDNVTAAGVKAAAGSTDNAAAAGVKAAAGSTDNAAAAGVKAAAGSTDNAAKNFIKKNVKYAKPLAKAGALAGVAGLGLALSGVFGSEVQNELENAASDLFGGILDTFGDLIPPELKQAFSYIIWIIIGFIGIFLTRLSSPFIGSNLSTILTVIIIIVTVSFILIDMSNDNETTTTT